MCDKCENKVFTAEGMVPCGSSKEDGTQFHCYECLETMVNNGHSFVETMALALFLMKDEYLKSGALSEDSLNGIDEVLTEIGFKVIEEPERPIYPH